MFEIEFHEKLQQLRKQKGLTQEQLAQALFVSRTAVSKWESGKGYPNIDSLKQIAKYFSVTIDELLSGNEALDLAEEEHKQKDGRFRSRVLGLLDLSAVMFFFLPFFRQQTDSAVLAVSLAALETRPYLKVLYCLAVLAVMLTGVLMLALKNCSRFPERHRVLLTLAVNVLGVLLFILSPQPYAAVYLFVLLVIKGLILIKKQ